MKRRIINQIYYFFSIIIILLLSIVYSKPIYGKLRFIYLNTLNPYYNIQYILKEVNFNNKFKSDPITEYSLYAAYGIKIDPMYKFKFLTPMSTYWMVLDDFIKESKSQNRKCIINLKGFSDTWVPYRTGHWDPIISNTARFYDYNGYRGKKLAIIIQNENKIKDECIVIKDKELPWEKKENFRFHSPNLNYTSKQQDVHILQFKKDAENKYNILIDVAQDAQVWEKLLDYLAMNEIYSIDEIYITHPHKDHYSGLYELIKFGIPIKKVWMNMPLKETCDKEIPWGCDYADLIKLAQLVKDKGIELKEIFHDNPGDPIIAYKDTHTELSILFANLPGNPKPKNIDINDLSIIMKLKTNGTTYMFTGDLNNPLSEYLKENPAFKADILKVPHHGTEGVASNNFFNTVGAKIGIVPSPQHLWCSDRSSRVRNYFKEKKIKMYISGFHGDILIRHFENGKYKIKTEVEPDRICEEERR